MRSLHTCLFHMKWGYKLQRLQHISSSPGKRTCTRQRIRLPQLTGGNWLTKQYTNLVPSQSKSSIADHLLLQRAPPITIFFVQLFTPRSHKSFYVRHYLNINVADWRHGTYSLLLFPSPPKNSWRVNWTLSAEHVDKLHLIVLLLRRSQDSATRSVAHVLSCIT